MTRTTAQDVRHAFASLVMTWENAGITRENPYTGQTFTAEHLTIQTGSQTYGRAYRLHYRDPDSGALYNALPTGGDFLGMTRREAVLSLDALRNGILAATEH